LSGRLRYIRDHNTKAKPFDWTKTPNDIFDKLARLPVPSEWVSARDRNNGRQRHWVASYCRSIVVSRSGAMIDRRMAMFAQLHVSSQAKPEMWRLPFTQEQRLDVA
jgi:hypothetical protein